MMQAAPGGVQMPQLALQQRCPGGQVVFPQRSPTGSGRQAMAGQAPPIGEQMPQLGLQQNSFGPQTFLPHGSPTGSGGQT